MKSYRTGNKKSFEKKGGFVEKTQQINEVKTPILNTNNLKKLKNETIHINNNAASQASTVIGEKNQSPINNSELSPLPENENKPKYVMPSISDFINSLPKEKNPDDIRTLVTQDDAKKMLENIIGKHKVLKEIDGTQIIFN
jgi:hypothetical protein